MSGEKTSRPRRGRAAKAPVAPGSGSKQKSIKDMFGTRGSKGNEADAIMQAQATMNLAGPSDAGPQAELLTTEEIIGPTESSQTTLNKSEPPVHTEVYPIFQKRKDTVEKELPLDPPPIHDSAIIYPVDDEPPHPIPARPSKPVHPFFTQSATAPPPPSEPEIIEIEDEFTEGSSRDAPIVIESSPVRPLKTLPSLKPTRTVKPSHPFFSKPLRVEQTKSDGRAIPGTAPPPFPDRDALHVTGFLQQLPSLREVFKRRTQTSPTSFEDDLKDLLPGSDFDWLKRGGTPEPRADPIFLPRVRTEQHTLSEAINHIPRMHQSHPSISRLLQHIDSQTPETTPEQDLWMDQWRPTCPQEVLGNERHASYLKDWMDALRLQHEGRDNISVPNGKAKGKSKGTKKRKRVKNKRPDIVRHVKRRRKDDYDEDFVVDDDFDTDEEDISVIPSSDFDDFAFCQEMVERANVTSLPSSADDPLSSPLSSPPHDSSDASESAFFPPIKTTHFGSQIHNTILLAGPSGCGKTAAVYACAKELGWDVFEVYPGIGERSGAELNKLIGDVGKNHIVKVQHQPSPKKVKPMDAFFQTGRARAGGVRRIDSDDEIDLISLPPPSGKENTPPEAESMANSDLAEPAVNQSVVLIEEVDVLYQTDTHFWPALINIIKDCRRPVILTCNDISHVPCLDLPLQTTLHFGPCPTPLAGSYLQAMCLAHGFEVERESLLRLYEANGAQDEAAALDLRRSIMQLQLLVADVKSHATASVPNAFHTPLSAPSAPEDALRTGESLSLNEDATSRVPPDQERQQALEFVKMTGLWESISFADAYLMGENSACLRDVFADGPGPSLDDILGYRVLYTDVNTDPCPVSLFYKQDQQLEEEVLRLSQRGVPQQLVDGLPITHSTRCMNITRMPHDTRVGPILRNFISEAQTRPWRASASQEALYLDYAPWIRYIVAADDALESVSQPSSQSRRSTRNSLKTGQDRWLKLGLDERRTLSETSLRLDWDDSGGSS